jgi:hypothetical protein
MLHPHNFAPILTMNHYLIQTTLLLKSIQPLFHPPAHGRSHQEKKKKKHRNSWVSLNSNAQSAEPKPL